MINKIIIFITLILLTLSTSVSLYFYRQNKLTHDPNYVTKVIDGDTFFLASAKKIRLREVNTPESGLCGSKEAKERLEQLVLNKVVRLQDPFYDHYGREVDLVYVGINFINEIILKEGLGRQESAGSSKTKILKAAHDYALNNHLGIYSPVCRAEKPDKQNCLIKGNKYPNGRDYYHYPGCDQYDQVIVEKNLGESWFCTENEAQKAGYIKAPGCR